MSRFAVVTLAFATALALGCRDNSNDNGQHDASINPHDGGLQQDGNNGNEGGTGGNTIKALRNAGTAATTVVTVDTAVVTGVNWSGTTSGTAKAYIQDADGGAKSGVILYCKYGGTATCSQADAIKALKVGNKVKVVGTWDIFNNQEEIKPTAVTVLDSTQGALPPAADVAIADAADTLTSSDYEGCLVNISGVSSSTPLTVTSMTPAGFINTNYSGCTAGPPYSAFEVSDSAGVSKIAVTTSFYRGIDLGTDPACIMIFDGGTPADKLVVVGDKFEKLQGVLDMDAYDMNGIILNPTDKSQYTYVAAGDHDGGL